MEWTDVSETFVPKLEAVNPDTGESQAVAWTRMVTDMQLDYSQSDYQAEFQNWVRANWKDVSAESSETVTFDNALTADFLAQWHEGVARPWYLQEHYLNLARMFGLLLCLKYKVINSVSQQYVQFRKIAHPMTQKPPPLG
ncbi:unnamed protein product [Amoebophrya sp. A120]|nr:unnamed protein product [Amoebophrya sp. A120]|eukprot:GSA120T00022582001.1